MRALLLLALAGLAAAQSPTIESVSGDLKFQLNKAGARVAVVVKDEEPVYFDELAKSGVQTSAMLESVYGIGKDTGAQECELARTNDQLNIQQQLEKYATDEDAKSLVDHETALRTAADTALENKLTLAIQNAVNTLGQNIDGKIDNLAEQLNDIEDIATSSSNPSGPPLGWVGMQSGNLKTTRASIIANKAGQVLKLFGVGLQSLGQWAYHPSLQHTEATLVYEDLTCLFTNRDTNQQSASKGHLVPLDDQGYFHVECPAPVVPGQSSYAVKLVNGSNTVPFLGLAGRDVLLADEYWSDVLVNNASGLYINIQGLQDDTLLKLELSGTTFKSDCVVKDSVAKCGTVKQVPVSDDGLIVGSGLKITVVNAVGVVLRPLPIGPIGLAESKSITINLCNNGAKEGSETDVDCGGACGNLCRETQTCKLDRDCGANGPRTCGITSRKCVVGDGSREEPAMTCKSLKADFPSLPSGIYWISGLGQTLEDPIQVYCEMTKEGGGWTMVLKSWYDVSYDQTWSEGIPVCSTSNEGNCQRVCGAQSIGQVQDATSQLGNRYKLDDEVVRKALIGPSKNFDIMVDQAGYNHYYSSNNYEYVVMTDYTAEWRFDRLVDTSSTAVNFYSYRLSDNFLAWRGELKCGTAGGAHPNGRGINCYSVIDRGFGIGAPNPSGGAGCRVSMGTQTSGGWHHVYMFEHNSDSYVYVCNGAQHSSSTSMNHRWYFRDRT